MYKALYNVSGARPRARKSRRFVCWVNSAFAVCNIVNGTHKIARGKRPKPLDASMVVQMMLALFLMMMVRIRSAVSGQSHKRASHLAVLFTFGVETTSVSILASSFFCGQG